MHLGSCSDLRALATLITKTLLFLCVGKELLIPVSPTSISNPWSLLIVNRTFSKGSNPIFAC